MVCRISRRRSMPCRSCITDESMELFSRYGVFNHREMHSRYDIALEQYILSIDVEAALTLEMATTVILPAAMRYQTELALNAVQPLGRRARFRLDNPRRGVSRARRRCGKGIATLRSEYEHDHADTEEKRAEHAQKALFPAMARSGVAADRARDLGSRRFVAAPHLPRDALHLVGHWGEGHARH